MLKSLTKQLELMLDYTSNHALKKYHNLHQGESCYIFGDGPSIKWFDLAKFGDLPGICSGLLPFHNDFSRLDIKYCLMIEPKLFLPKIFNKNNQHNIQYKSISDKYKSFINGFKEVQFFVHLSNIPFLFGDNVNYLFRNFPKNCSISVDALRKFQVFSGSFHASVSLARFLGFKRIYLIGFDGWTLQPARALHWYEFGEGVFFEPTNFATDYLNIINKDMEIFTIAYDGISRNVNSINYEIYTGIPPKYKENYELLSNENMKIIASYSSYNMYSKNI